MKGIPIIKKKQTMKLHIILNLVLILSYIKTERTIVDRFGAYIRNPNMKKGSK